MEKHFEVHEGAFGQAALTRGQAARALQISEDAITRLLNEGRLLGVKVGRAWRISPRSVLEFATGGDL